MAPAANTILASFTASARDCVVGALDRLDLDAEALLDRLGRLIALVLGARGDGDVGALLGEERRRAHADRAGAGEHHGLLALELLRLGEQRHAGRRRGVRAVGVEHDRDAERPEEALLHRREHRLALRHVAAADEDRRRLLVLAAAGDRWCRRPARRHCPA